MLCLRKDLVMEQWIAGLEHWEFSLKEISIWPMGIELGKTQIMRYLCLIKAWVGVEQDLSDLDLWSVDLFNINTIE
jgi:hypothetical protein